MSVDTHHHGPPPPTTRPTRPPSAAPHGPFARIVAGVPGRRRGTALVLDPRRLRRRAPRPPSPGRLLAGFGLGWALIGVLSRRRTDQPQRLGRRPRRRHGRHRPRPGRLHTPERRPDRDELDLAAAHAGPGRLRSGVHARATVTGRASLDAHPGHRRPGPRILGATYENVSVVRDQHTYAAPGTQYDVDGHRLHLDCRGEGSPTVVLSNGLGEVSASWARITAPVAATTRVCAYDRAGQGWSDDAESPQDGVTAAEDLHTLLAQAGEHGPYVLVGHSIGGTYAMTYAAQYPRQVAGMVLLDSSSPEQFTAIPQLRRPVRRRSTASWR